MTKKALVIGINYIGTNNELKGCINDAVNIKNYLLSQGFTQNNIVIMTELSENLERIPNKDCIINQIKLLVLGAKKGDTLFLSYSGHGSHVLDTSKDERDGRDETIVSLDLQMIIDDDLRKMLVDPLPSGVKLTCLFDCCHSGTGLDLRYNYQFYGQLSEKTTRYITDIDKHYKDSNANVVLISGCKDPEYSADAWIKGKAQGALTYAFLRAVKKDRTYVSLLRELRLFMKNNEYSQVPQLSCGRSLDLNTKFSVK